MEQPTFFFVYYHVFVLMTCLTRHSVFGSEELKKGQWTCSYYPTTVTSSSTGPISARQTPPSPAAGAGTNATTRPSASTARRSPSSTTSPATRSCRSLSSPTPGAPPGASQPTAASSRPAASTTVSAPPFPSSPALTATVGSPGHPRGVAVVRHQPSVA